MNDTFFEKLADRALEWLEAGKIDEFKFRDEVHRIVLRRNPPPPTQMLPPLMSPLVPPVPGTGDGSVLLNAEAPRAVVPGNVAQITAPIVGVFYASPQPDAPPFAERGMRIKQGQVLCILEAMKQMNHLEAEYDCEICEVLVHSGDLVEYGQPLFSVKKLHD
jgi:acetyl-CoA carboxylase biotin carboxyl carrier protein